MKTILSVCDYSGAWSRPYKDAGYRVIQVDPKFWNDDFVCCPSCDDKYVETAQELAKGLGGTLRPWDYWPDAPKVHGLLLAPPCTDFAVSGAQWWAAKDQDGRTQASLEIIDACLELVRITKPEWWCLENPVGRLPKLRPELGKPKVYVQPYEFAGWSDDPPKEAYTKKTGLWGEFKHPEKKIVQPIRVCQQGSWIQKLGGKSERTKELRSITPSGFARAFYEANP